jgi:hypothetical protein
MRRLFAFAILSLVAACARAPRTAPGPTPAPVERPSGVLIGLTASDLAGRCAKDPAPSCNGLTAAASSMLISICPKAAAAWSGSCMSMPAVPPATISTSNPA